MPVVPFFDPSTGASGGPIPGGGGPDLTAPSTPAPVSLAAGSTSLGSTSIGSWSAAVTVTATVQGSDGSTPTAVVSGSGAGPYSVSVASGLQNNVSYAIRLRGTGADGQVADVTLLVAVGVAMAWKVLQTYNLMNVDTASAVTTTGGDIALTVGGAPFLTLKSITGGGTGSITPTNGSGLIYNVASGGTRGGHFDIDWGSFGCDPSFDGVGFMWEMDISSVVDGGAIVPMLHTSGSGFSANYSVGPRFNRTASNYTINARFYNSAANISANWATGGAFSGTYSGAAVILPGGFSAWAHDAAMPASPSAMTYGPRRASISQGWVTTALHFPAGPPKAAFGVDSAVSTLRKFSLIKWGV